MQEAVCRETGRNSKFYSAGAGSRLLTDGGKLDTVSFYISLDGRLSGFTGRTGSVGWGVGGLWDWVFESSCVCVHVCVGVGVYFCDSGPFKWS